MYFDPQSATATFVPAINSRSYQMMGNVVPIEKRASDVAAAREAKVADLAHSLDLQRRQTETFKPKINPTSDQLAQAATQRRVPLAERTNAQAEREQQMLQRQNEPLPPTKSLMDPHSRKMMMMNHKDRSGDFERSNDNDDVNYFDGDHQKFHQQQKFQQHHQQTNNHNNNNHVASATAIMTDVKRKVRQLWADHAESTTMSALALRRVLTAVGLDGATNDVLWVKFLVALDVKSVMHGNSVISPVPANGKKHHDDIEYDKFLKVFSALLASSSNSSNSSSSSSNSVAIEQQKQSKQIVSETKPKREEQPQQQLQQQRSASSSVPPVRNVPKQNQQEIALEPKKRASSEMRSIVPKRNELVSHHQQQNQHLHVPPPTTVAEWMGTTTASSKSHHERDERKSSLSLATANGFDEAIKRMQQAREKKKFKFEESLRGTENQEQVKKLHNQQQQQQNSGGIPFHLHSQERAEQKEKEKPLLHIEVNLPGGKKGKISVHHGDTAKKLSQQFAESHNLFNNNNQDSTGMVARLERLVQSEMDKFFTSEEGRKILRRVMTQEHQRRMQEYAEAKMKMNEFGDDDQEVASPSPQSSRNGYASRTTLGMKSMMVMNSSKPANQNRNGGGPTSKVEISPSKKQKGTWEFSL